MIGSGRFHELYQIGLDHSHLRSVDHLDSVARKNAEQGQVDEAADEGHAA